MLFIQKLCHALNGQNAVYAVVGGHAVAFHGAPRGTIDIDFVVEWQPENLIVVQSVLQSIGLISRQPLDAIDVFQFRDEYINKRGLIAWNFYNPHDLTENIDIVINFDLSKEDIVWLDVGIVGVPVLSLPRLIQMKQASKRAQDKFDLDALYAIEQRNQQHEP